MDNINKRWATLAEQGYVIEVSPGQVDLIDESEWGKKGDNDYFPRTTVPHPTARPFSSMQTREWRDTWLFVKDKRQKRLDVYYLEPWYETDILLEDLR